MQDGKIVELFFNRSEAALAEVREKYGRYLKKTAYNILGDVQDSEECFSDVLLSAWSSIPPQKPENLRSYLLKLTRRRAVDILRLKGRDKRRASEYSVSLEELGDCLPAKSSPEQDCDLKLLSEAINDWLGELSAEQRNAFIGRYYFADSVRDISKYLGISEAKTKTLLFRARKSLRERLEKECLI